MLLYQLKFSIYRKIPYGERAFSKTFSWERWGGGGGGLIFGGLIHGGIFAF